MTGDKPAMFSSKGTVGDGHHVQIITEAAESGEAAEKEAEKVHMDLKARAQKIHEAISEGDIHPDDATPMFEVAWDRVLGLDNGECTCGTDEACDSCGGAA